jgi:hypothetical protein
MIRVTSRRFSLAHTALPALAALVLAAAGVLGTGGSALAASNYSLLILPDQGETSIYNFINSATSSIDVTMYELRDTTVETDLVNREKAGVNVRVILDGAQKSVNGTAFSTLQAGGVSVTYSSTAFTFTHQKAVTVDNRESFISTGNLDSTFYSTSRDYGVFDTDAADVAAVVAVFNADFAKTSITPSDGDDLVWSPTDSQTHLLALINGAQHTLDVEQEEFSDTALVNAIVAAEKRGVTVRVVVESPSSYTTELNEVTAAGGKVTGYTDPNGFYIHAKAIIADYGTATAKIFLGSENFSDNSLNDNRELGLIITDPAVMTGDQPRQPDLDGRHRGEPADRGDRHRGRNAQLLGDRAPGRTVDQRHHRQDFRHSDDGRQRHGHGDRHRFDRPVRVSLVYLDGEHGRDRMHGSAVARQPRFRDRHRRAVVRDLRRHRRQRQGTDAQRNLGRLAGRSRHHAHRHFVPGRHGAQRLLDVPAQLLAAHRHRRDFHDHGVRHADRAGTQ